MEFRYTGRPYFIVLINKTGEGNRTPVIFFSKNMVLPLNYAHSRGYGAGESFLLKRLNLIADLTADQITSPHTTALL